MSDTANTQILIAGAGPVGLTAAIELTRRGVDCIVLPLLRDNDALDGFLRNTFG